MGFLMGKEINTIEKAMQNPDRPFVAILGGAKVADKIGVVKNLMEKADSVLIGGAMSFTFLKAQGVNVGTSIVDEKQNFEELRAKKQEIDKLIPEIEIKNDICYQLYENIQYEKTKLTNYQNEINTRNNRLEELKSEYNTIIGKGNTSSKEQVIKLKTETIKAKLDELLAQKIPEAGLSNNIKAKDESEKNGSLSKFGVYPVI